MRTPARGWLCEVASVGTKKRNLVGGLEHLLFSIIYGIILPIDKYFSRWLKPPTSNYNPINHQDQWLDHDDSLMIWPGGRDEEDDQWLPHELLQAILFLLPARILPESL